MGYLIFSLILLAIVLLMRRIVLQPKTTLITISLQIYKYISNFVIIDLY